MIPIRSQEDWEAVQNFALENGTGIHLFRFSGVTFASFEKEK